MEPIKIEDNIREKLQEREINPSKDAWEKLYDQFDKTPIRNRKKRYWIAVAASFIGIILIASFLFKDEIIPSSVTPGLVEENTEIIEEKDQKQKIIPSENKMTDLVSKENTQTEKNKEDNKQTEIKKHKGTIKNNSTIAVSTEILIKEAVTIDNSKISDSSNSVEKNQDDLLINSKVDEVVAQVKALQNENKPVGAEEVNVLLLRAQSEIESQKITYRKNKKVDAAALLNQVEYELETSFREKVFEALGDGFEMVRTAVAERNN